jgi:hypothetical protein
LAIFRLEALVVQPVHVLALQYSQEALAAHQTQQRGVAVAEALAMLATVEMEGMPPAGHLALEAQREALEVVQVEVVEPEE